MKCPLDATEVLTESSSLPVVDIAEVRSRARFDPHGEVGARREAQPRSPRGRLQDPQGPRRGWEIHGVRLGAPGVTDESEREGEWETGEGETRGMNGASQRREESGRHARARYPRLGYVVESISTAV